MISFRSRLTSPTRPLEGMPALSSPCSSNINARSFGSARFGHRLLAVLTFLPSSLSYCSIPARFLDSYAPFVADCGDHALWNSAFLAPSPPGTNCLTHHTSRESMPNEGLVGGAFPNGGR